MMNTKPNETQIEDTNHSFVIRMWQERPGEWRGTIRHVQSETHLGFQNIEQAVTFVEKHTQQVRNKVKQNQRQILQSKADLSVAFSPKTMRMVMVAATLILVIAATLLAVGGSTNLAAMAGFGH